MKVTLWMYLYSVQRTPHWIIYVSSIQDHCYGIKLYPCFFDFNTSIVMKELLLVTQSCGAKHVIVDYNWEHLSGNTQ